MIDDITKTNKQEIPLHESVEHASNKKTYIPPTDIINDPRQAIIYLDIPGVNIEDIDITVEKNVLNIYGKIQKDIYQEMSLVYSEFELGDFTRSFNINSSISIANIKAELKDGVLKIVLPKVEPETKKITVIEK